ncbi:CHAT domain-containing protein [Aurantiacibacter sp. D1-12]|uniref:CHAT domain-containing protein n=1 Tax=Aurantiacibacter sp. D1-12 TaxID=2993658 RepID=UPI00237C73F8|nr:CHAT domain-containing protein [Aurantiacibacter sp. D1-12]MDE1467288.1 CHAT domain-containing protein [Aurantiacibacter sp. D1-12]
MMRSLGKVVMFAAGLGLLATTPSTAQDVPTSLRDSVPIGSNGLCEAQIRSPEAQGGLFDREYAIICQDASIAVGSLAVFSGRSMDSVLGALAHDGLTCRETELGDVPAGVDNLRALACREQATNLNRLLLVGNGAGRTYAAEGIAVYADALTLGMATLATDAQVEGTVEVPLTLASDDSAFARAQAEAIGARSALVEAYRRANAGNYADAAEFFAASADALEGGDATEALLNAALQQSNLGNYFEAALLFIDIRELIDEDPILARMARNYEALDALNRERPGEAIMTLDMPLPGSAASLDALREMQVSMPLADRLAAENGNAISGATGELTELERAQLLDAQSLYVRAAALRADNRPADARDALVASRQDILAVRDGRVVSVLWLRAQILSEIAEIDERTGDLGSAEYYHGEAIALLEAFYPSSPSLASAQAQFAGFLARNGREDEALVLYRSLVENADTKPSAALRRLLAPYFALLIEREPPGMTREFFDASQLMLRPGLAQTQAVMARELSGGSDEASQLFRQTLNVGRGIEQLRVQIAQADLDASVAGTPTGPEVEEMRTRLRVLEIRQLELQQALAEYPRYRVVEDGRMDLQALQATLQAGEAYYKLVMLDDASYAIFVTPGTLHAFRLDADSQSIEQMVGMLRDSIAVELAGQTITYPFEMATAHDLYAQLFDPVEQFMQGVDHLVFEPDGAMLRLPVNLLVRDDASVQRHAARVEAGGDEYDYRGTAWLGRDMRVTTSVSPTSFRDVRATRVSDAQMDYLGLGQNAPLGASPLPMLPQGAGGMVSERCMWGASTWNDPIAAGELRTAQAALRAGGASAQLLTDAAFSDTALLGMEQLDEYRILHFATHGLVTAPASECPPRPALLTSFGDGNSDGLLSFSEIFDLQIDADLVVLSACNTASEGGLVASQEAGISGAGDFALDGLVRAFVGAGGRTVVASHWPVPDEYDATQRLVSGLFSAGEGETTTEALRRAQLGLMDDAEASHPFYWAAFAVVGDGTITVRR